MPGSRSNFSLLAVLALLPLEGAPAQDCAVAPDPSWKDAIAFADEPFAVDPGLNPRWVKFTLLACDPAQVIFQDSVEFPFHYEFATEHLDAFRGMSREEFDAATLHVPGQVAVLGAVILPPRATRNATDFGIQFAGKDPYPAARTVELFHAVRESVAGDGLEAYYFPAFEQQRAAEESAAFLEANGVRLGSADRWSAGNPIYSQGWALGTLRFVPSGEIEAAYLAGTLRPEHVLLTDGVPAEVPFVSGIVSLAPATPNSHVAILARGYGVPFVYLARPDDAARAEELEGREVIVAAFQSFGGTEVRLLDVEGRLAPELRTEILALKALPPLDITPVARTGSYSLAVGDLRPADIGKVGGKAANYSLLLRAIPENTRVAAAFTFDLWLDFLSQELPVGRTLREEIETRLRFWRSYPPSSVGILADLLDEIRELFEDPQETTFSPELQEAVIATLEDPRFGFDASRKIRFRSSTNVEDSEQFTGAGLYESRSGCLLDDVDADTLGPSHCDPAMPLERGVFRAIRRVFASFYNENAYLERIRWGVDESQVGMGILVHHSFPDELELANGVATLAPDGPNYRIEMVSQVGATSVANPSDGSLPETVSLHVFNAQTVAELVEGSNLLPLGATVLEWKEDYERFAGLFVAVARAFEAETEKTRYTLDFEYKKVAPGGELVVKQVREIPQADGSGTIAPFLIGTSTTFTTFQGEFGDLFANHRLKSSWTLEARSVRLVPENLRDGIFSRLALEYTDGCDVFRFDGDVASLPGAEQSYGDDGAARLRFRFDHLANPRRYELAAPFLPLSVPASRSPFVTLEDLFLIAQASYDRPVLGWDDLSGSGDLRSEESIALAPRPILSSGDLDEERSLAENGISITTRFYWPPPPAGIVAGYTAPLIRWQETVIEGLTSELIVLRGERSQTYRPEHHNFTEHFLFAPHEEDGISAEVVAELDARDIRWIHMTVGNGTERIVTYGACEVALACACDAGDPLFWRGDANDDGTADVSDAVFTLGWLFLGGPEPGCLAAADTNGDRRVDLSDASYLLNYLFLGGPPPAKPFPECGPEAPEAEPLDCRLPPAAC